MGKSGYAAAELAIELGHDVLACDRATTESLTVDLNPLLAKGMVFYGGSESAGLLKGVELVVLSPGVPRRSELVKGALDTGIPVIGEIEWAFRHAAGSIVAVTGSNGKSTTTTMVGKIMSAHLPDVRTGGNLGTPFSSMVKDSSPQTWFVLEVSSFQLESIERFKAHVAVLLNLSPDHQDRYESYEDYQEAKGRIFLNQHNDDWAVYPSFDSPASLQTFSTPARKVAFAINGELENGAFAKNGKALWRHGAGEEILFSLESLRLPGKHNLGNAIAAGLAARLAGIPEGGAEAPIAAFPGLPHRLEKVGVVNGAAIYNDSKATNTGAVQKALVSFDGGVILLLGGKDKGADWALIGNETRKRCKAVVAFGEARAKVKKGLLGFAPVSVFRTLREATAGALKLAGPGDTILLSPACASFDEFNNFEERGECFKSWVMEAMTP